MSKKVKKVCQCENCGNESEMIITCSLEEVGEEEKISAKGEQEDSGKKVKGSAVCSHCGNEADMWIDM